jgi:hypothetical protein
VLLSDEDAEDLEGGHRPGGEAVPGLDKGARTMSGECFSSVWDAIEDTPAAAENLMLRTALIPRRRGARIPMVAWTVTTIG